MRSVPKQQLAIVVASTGLLAAVIALTAVVLKPSFCFEVFLRSSTAGNAQIFYDIGKGTTEQDSVRVSLGAVQAMTTYRAPLPAATYLNIRFDPLDHGNAEVVVGEARIIDLLGRVVRKFSPPEFVVSSGITSSQSTAEGLALKLGPADYDPILQLSLPQPLPLNSGASRWLYGGAIFSISWVVMLAAGFLWLICAPIIWRKAEPYANRGASRARQSPALALLAIALLSVAINCYPIVFLGKSFVSGNIASMLYSNRPTLPGYQDAEMEDFKGSDAGAMIWQNLPYSYVEGRALRQDGELPLWNRYNSCGVTLLGQGQSMFGDPLNMLVLLAGQTSWAWDLKFLLAKVLFCWALGLTVFASVKHLPSALLLCFSSSFLGFFALRFDHPAFFSMCYAPWILLCWVELSQASSIRRAAGWAIGLVLASWTELTSGTVKEAYMLLLSMHGCGFLVFLMATRINRGRKLALAMLAGLIFVLLASPLVLSLWTALQNSFTGYKGGARGYQIQPGLLIALFDDIFYRALTASGQLFNPSANFFILLGVIFTLIHLRVLVRERIFVGLIIGTVAFFAITFGGLPGALIEVLPMVKHVWHTDIVFSCVLIIDLIVLAGFGLRSYMMRGVRQLRWNCWVAAAILFALLGLYFGFTGAVQRWPANYAPLGSDAPRSAFFYFYVSSLVIAVVAFPWLGKAIITKSKCASLAVPAALLCFIALHWREGFHIKTGVAQIDDAVVNPLVRVNFQAPSPALLLVKEIPGTYRTVGFGDILFAGYNAMAGLESISGPDALMNPFYHELMLSSKMPLTWGWRAEVVKKDLAVTLPLLNLLNVGLFLDEPRRPEAPHAALDRVGSLDLDVYRNKTSWPRAFFVDQVQQYGSLDEFLRLVQEHADAPMAAVQKEGPGSPKVDELPAMVRGLTPIVSPASNYKLTNNTTTFTVDAPSAGVAVLTETYLGDEFIARLNGVRSDYFRVNHAFRGIKIPGPGRYEISFSYWPKYFTESLIMFCVGAGLLILWVTAIFRPLPFGRRSKALHATASA